MTKNLTRASVIFLLSGLFLPYPSLLLAAADSPFNPNFLISDEEMQQWESMTRADIQAFLSDRGGYIASLDTEDHEGKVRPTSDIVYRSAKEYKINPKYLLVKLQKEQSLVTDPDPTQRQLDFATGYACPDSAPCSEKYRGFGKQVDAAAGIMRWYYDNVDIEGWIKRPQTEYIIDDTVVQPANFATAFLYTYTPHLHGNKNFWKLWQTWFDQIYPDGTLVKSASEDIVYLIQNGDKRPFSSLSALTTRYNPKLVLTVPESELARYETGLPISLPNYSLVKAGSTYYMLDYDLLRPFASFEVVTKLGLGQDEVIELNESELPNYTIATAAITVDTSSPLGKVIRVKENNKLYYLKDGLYHPLFDEQIAKINFPHLTIQKGTAADLASYSQGDPILLKEGTLFGETGSNKIYVVERERKRHITSEEVFDGLGYQWNNIIWVNEFTGLAHPIGQPVYLRQDTTTKSVAESNKSDQELSAPQTDLSKMVKIPVEQVKFVGPVFDTSVDTYLVALFDTGEVLAGKNVDAVRPMASFTKVMTAYRLQKEGLRLSKSVTYDPKKHQAPYHKFRIAAGERVLNRHLMYALLVSSLNTPARMLVDSVSDDEAGFIKEMNNQAKSWGLTKTVFTDTHGYDVGNKSTAKEFLTIFREAATDLNLRAMMALPSYEYDELHDIDEKPHHYDDNSNDLMQKNYGNVTILASKTGYLDEAGAGLVMLVERKTDGKKFVIMTMGNPDYAKRFHDPEKLMLWAITQF